MSEDRSGHNEKRQGSLGSEWHILSTVLGPWPSLPGDAEWMRFPCCRVTKSHIPLVLVSPPSPWWSSPESDVSCPEGPARDKKHRAGGQPSLTDGDIPLGMRGLWVTTAPALRCKLPRHTGQSRLSSQRLQGTTWWGCDRVCDHLLPTGLLWPYTECKGFTIK